MHSDRSTSRSSPDKEEIVEREGLNGTIVTNSLGRPITLRELYNRLTEELANITNEINMIKYNRKWNNSGFYFILQINICSANNHTFLNKV